MNDEYETADESTLKRNAYEAFKAMVLEFGSFESVSENGIDGPILVSGTQLRGDRFGGIKSKFFYKKYEPVLLNAVITDNFDVIPYGY